MNATTKTTKTVSKTPIAHGVGRRKSAVARVWLRRGKGEISVNGKVYSEYFPSQISQQAVTTPAQVYAGLGKMDIDVNVTGGGLNGQADAVKLGIARAVVSFDENAREVMRQAGLLTVDSRLKERKKYGQKAARRKFQFVKR